MTYEWDEDDYDWGSDVDPMIMSAVIDRLWVEKAACKDSDSNTFFLERGQSDGLAKKVCYSCPVHEPCLEYAMSMPGPTVGIWGGLSENERRRLKRLRKKESE